MQIVDLQRKKICPSCQHLDEGSFCGRCGAALDLPEARAGEILAMHMQAQGFRDFRKSPYAARFEALGSGFDIQLVRTDGFDRERIVDAVFIGEPPSSPKHPMHNPARVAESIARFLKSRKEHYNHIQVYYLIPATRSHPADYTTDTRRFGLLSSVKVSVVRYDPWRPNRFPRSSIKPIFNHASRQIAGRTDLRSTPESGFSSLAEPVLSPIRDYLQILGSAVSPVRLSREVTRGAMRLHDVFTVGLTSVVLVNLIAWLHGGERLEIVEAPIIDEVLAVVIMSALILISIAPLHLVLKRLSGRPEPPRFRKAFILMLMSAFVMLPLMEAIRATRLLGWTPPPALEMLPVIHATLALGVFYAVAIWKVLLVQFGLYILFFIVGFVGAMSVQTAIAPY